MVLFVSSAALVPTTRVENALTAALHWKRPASLSKAKDFPRYDTLGDAWERWNFTCRSSHERLSSNQRVNSIKAEYRENRDCYESRGVYDSDIFS
jgi:hypothetical protein